MVQRELLVIGIGLAGVRDTPVVQHRAVGCHGAQRADVLVNKPEIFAFLVLDVVALRHVAETCRLRDGNLASGIGDIQRQLVLGGGLVALRILLGPALGGLGLVLRFLVADGGVAADLLLLRDLLGLGVDGCIGGEGAESAVWELFGLLVPFLLLLLLRDALVVLAVHGYDQINYYNVAAFLFALR